MPWAVTFLTLFRIYDSVYDDIFFFLIVVFNIALEPFGVSDSICTFFLMKKESENFHWR